MRFQKPAAVAAILVGCAFASGCSGDGSYHVSGTVTFDGKPVPEGKIYFLPDSTKGNVGAAGYAEIKNGQYDTRAPGGQGMVGGPMKIAIEGRDSAQAVDTDNPEEAPSSALFPRYEVDADMPKESTTKDFDVPADAVKGKPAPKRPAYEP